VTPLQSAVARVRAAQGLDGPPSDWTYEQRTRYMHALAAEILRAPELYPAASVEMANRVSVTTYPALQDTSFHWTEFAGELGRNAAAPFQAIGDGVLTVASAARWAIPAAVAVAAVLYLSSKPGAVRLLRALRK
jgi:hypothetical protein